MPTMNSKTQMKKQRLISNFNTINIYGTSSRTMMINHWKMQSNVGNIKNPLKVITDMRKVTWRHYYEKGEDYSHEKGKA